MNAVLLVSHGSRSRKSREEIDALASRLRAAAGAAVFESAFLEIETPSIAEGLETCVQKGADRITVLLNFLNSGRHVLEDIPRILADFERSHAGVRCVLTPAVGSHPGMDALYLDLIERGGRC